MPIPWCNSYYGRYLTWYFFIKRIKDSKIREILCIFRSSCYNVLECFTAFFEIPVGQRATHFYSHATYREELCLVWMSSHHGFVSFACLRPTASCPIYYNRLKGGGVALEITILLSGRRKLANINCVAWQNKANYTYSSSLYCLCGQAE